MGKYDLAKYLETRVKQYPKTFVAACLFCSILIAAKGTLYYQKHCKLPRGYSTKKIRTNIETQSIKKTIRNGFSKKKLPSDYQKHCKLPRGYSTKKIRTNIETQSIKKTIRNGFSKKKLPSDIDIIIIGSGISGLSCGALLSMTGKRVLILEQHYIAGGCTHSFEEKGIEFDTGIHYVGNMGENGLGATKTILDLISNHQIKWDQIGTNKNDINQYERCYDEIVIGDKTYNLRAGKDEWLNEIKKHFEQEQVMEAERFLNEEILQSKKPLDRYFESKMIKYKWLQTLYLKLFNASFFDKIQENAIQLVQRYTKNKDLEALLLAIACDVGTNPETIPGLIYSNVCAHYMNGGYYPNGGCSQIAYHLINTIKRSGGDVLVRKRVKHIVINPKTHKVQGIEMENGVQINAKVVVSAAGLYNTYNKLIQPQFIPKTIAKKVNDIEFSGSFVYLFVGLNGTAEDLELRSHNIWSFPHGDYVRLFKEMCANPSTAPIPLFMGFPCCKDKSWNDRYPGKSNAVILSVCDFKEFEQWKDRKQGKRGKEYEAKKEMYCQRILNEGLFKYFPKTRDKILFTEIGTPLTFNHFIGSNRGEVYGLDVLKERFGANDFFRADHSTNEINGLYVTGQDTTMLGFTASCMAGVITAHRVLNYGGITDLLSGRNLIRDIGHT
eukprot:13438_1